MPLFKGSSKHVISLNIAEMRRAGKTEAQSTMIALKSASKSKAEGKAERVAKNVVKHNPLKVFGT